MNQSINAILQLKENNMLAEIPLEPAEIEELNQHIYEDLHKRFEELKEVNTPIFHVLSNLYEGKTAFKTLINNCTQLYPEFP